MCVHFQAVYPALHGWTEGLQESSWRLTALSLEFWWVESPDPPEVRDFSLQDMLTILRGPNLEWA